MRYKKRGFLFGVVISVFLLGLFLAAAPWEQWSLFPSSPRLDVVLRHVLPKLGDAFMIAMILVVAIEIAAANELLKTFAENISHHIVGRLLPPELREHILGYLTTTFVRTRWFIEYRLEEWAEKPRFIRLATLTEYEVENRSGSEQEYCFVYQVEQSWSPGVGDARICNVCATADGKTIVHYVGRGLDLHAKTRMDS